MEKRLREGISTRGWEAQAEVFSYNLDGQVVTVTGGVVDGTHAGAVGITGVLATATYTTGQLSRRRGSNGESIERKR